jgi:sulfide:quinone oxidoreductase
VVWEHAVARAVVLGAGVSGHTAALYLRKYLGREHEVVVVTPNSKWNWIPSNIWVGVGEMTKKDVTFPLAPIYKRKHIDYRQARAVAIRPEGNESSPKPTVEIVYTAPDRSGMVEHLEYDYLINATGPKLNFGATPGLGPDAGNSVSVCTADHAEHASAELAKAIEKLKAGQKQTFLIGTGHGTCTCQGAAFEYTFNVEHELRQHGVRDRAEVIYITNEYELGDFGVAGLHFEQQGFVSSSQTFTESLFQERGVRAILRAHVERVEPGKVHYETLDGQKSSIAFDFAMLLPPFTGVGFQAFDRAGNDITSEVFAPNGFMKVDADYTKKPFEEWRASDWPRTYQNPTYRNVFAAGIAFAPPHQISKPRSSPNGTVITPAPPRTGMPSGVIGRTVALTIRDMIKKGATEPTHHASLTEEGAACIASAGKSLTKGSAAAMTMFPIVPDYEKYPKHGRNVKDTYGEIGLNAHWMKHVLHYVFIYKAKALPGWWMLPE